MKSVKRLSVLFALMPGVVFASSFSLTVFKSPSCGCCGKWINAFDSEVSIETHNTDQMAMVKQKAGIPQKASSCHTAVSDSSFVYEGHVPTAMVKAYESGERSENGRGLVVPGMPVGSEGMEMGNRFDPYVVYEILGDGSAKVYREVHSPADHAH